MNLDRFLERMYVWSQRTFGPGDGLDRYAGLRDHIEKELDEVRAEPNSVEEWLDIVALAFDGALRAAARANPGDAGGAARTVSVALLLKQTENEHRKWQDWRTTPKGKAIEHIMEKKP